MKIFLIADNTDTLIGMRLAGISGVVVRGVEEILAELKKACENKEIGIILITEVLAEKVQDEVDKIKLAKNKPLLLEIPDRHGMRRPADYLTKYIRESIGLKI